MPHLAIQPSINDLRSQSLLTLIERLGALDLTPILVYRLDSVPDSALLALAWQFDMLAPQWQSSSQSGESIDALNDIDSLTDVDVLTSGGDLAGPSDYDSWRALLRSAIPLHRTRGTPYAIKSALASLGWTNVTLLEGQATWGGNTYPPAQGWAVFRVLINVASEQLVKPGDAASAKAAITFFKPARAWLDSLWFVAAPLASAAPVPQDTVVSIFSQVDERGAPKDMVSAYAWNLSDTKLTTPRYDAHFHHGGLTYGANQPAIVDGGTIVNGAEISVTTS